MVETGTQDRFRIAMRLSLWAWAAYWPGGGLLLLMLGFNLLIFAVTLLSLGAFVALLVTGALRADSSRNMRQFLIERPFYLVLAAVVFIALVPAFGFLADAGLAIFSAVYFAAICYAASTLIDHVRRSGQTIFEAKADQAIIVFGLVGISTALIFLDAWLPILGVAPVGGPKVIVAMGNWINLLYPPMLMLAAKPFRDPLRLPRRRRGPTPVPALTATPADLAEEG